MVCKYQKPNILSQISTLKDSYAYIKLTVDHSPVVLRAFLLGLMMFSIFSFICATISISSGSHLYKEVIQILSFKHCSMSPSP